MLASSVSGQAYLAVNASDPLKRPDATAQLVCFTGKNGQVEPGQRIEPVVIEPEGGAKKYFVSFCRSARSSRQPHRVMYKLIAIIITAIPVVLFLRTFFGGRSKKRSQGVSNCKKQVDYVVWAMVILIGFGFV